MHKAANFFDRLEDRIRVALSHRPIIYSLIGGVGIVLFWKGVWETAEYFPALFGPVSILLGIVILLSTGLLVSFFIGDGIILSGLAREKKLAERTAHEMRSESGMIEEVAARLERIEHALTELLGSR